MKTYTIDLIQAEMTAAGSHWWSKGALRFFRCRVSAQVYQGEGGVYFVTSEKPPHGSRKFSVRQYKPETKNVSTVGEFCSMSRSQAHREAARLAGPEAVVVAEAHTPITARDQFALDLERGGCRLTPAAVPALIREARKHKKIMEDHCNGADPYDQDGEPLPPLARVRETIEAYADQIGCKGVHFGGDPRGCTVKLILPNEATNDWGQEGWCVPGA